MLGDVDYYWCFVGINLIVGKVWKIGYYGLMYEIGLVILVVVGGWFGKYRDVVNIGVFGGLFFR